jgi:hypothetical protein
VSVAARRREQPFSGPNAHRPEPGLRSQLGLQGAAVARRKRTGSSKPKTRQGLYEVAKKRNLAGLSKMGRDKLARALGMS